jgi:hypothetical protein
MAEEIAMLAVMPRNTCTLHEVIKYQQTAAQ